MLNRIVMAAGLEPPRINVPYEMARIGGRAIEKVWDRRATDGEPPMTSFLAEQLGTAHWFDQRETGDALGWTPAVRLSEGFQRLHDWFAAGRAEGDRSVGT